MLMCSSKLKKNINFKMSLPDFHFGVPQQLKVATHTISHKRYWEILFQKVASGYLLHFVQDGSSKNALEKICLRKNVKHPKIMKNALYIPPPYLPINRPLEAAIILDISNLREFV